MADGLIRRQKTEDRGQILVRAPRGLLSMRGAAATKPLSSVLCLLSSVACLLSSVFCYAEELPDPTRPPANLVAPVVAPAGGAVVNQPAGLHSIIISKTRRAAIIDGETVELGGKYGDAKLIEVNEGSVVLRGAQGRQVMTLFPDVKITGKHEIKIKPQSSAGEAQSGKQKPVAHYEKLLSGHPKERK